MWKVILIVAFFAASGSANDCIPRSFGTGKIVCVCNATYCDNTPVSDPKIPEEGSYHWYVSTKDGQRLKLYKAKFNSEEQDSSEILIVDSSKKYQKIVGFGGAFTDSAGLNIKKLSPATQDQLIRTYYDQQTGSRYTFGRVPIGGSDFSTRPYTYDDTDNDANLEHFALAPEDHEYKIPFMQKAAKLNPKLKLVGAVWSPPSWMKTNGKNSGFGFLKHEYYQVYANYMEKFLTAYKEQGLGVWAVSTGNEPANAFIPFDPLSSMGWTPETVAKWVSENLGPTLASSVHNQTKILAHDDQRNQLPFFVAGVFKNEKARNYSSGIAVHWYADAISSPTALDRTQKLFPEKFILMTEACTGSNIYEHKKVDLGSWDRGEQYISSIIQYLNHWSIGWIDWNLALDKKGGPNWIKNNVDSPIIVIPETDEFYKQPMLYAIKHFSRFIDSGSDRIAVTQTSDIKATAALTPDNQVVVVLHNTSHRKKTVTIKDRKKGSLTAILPGSSMNTIVYKL